LGYRRQKVSRRRREKIVKIKRSSEGDKMKNRKGRWKKEECRREMEKKEEEM
jgi:hypothetical protein